jgi:PAS domain S-box-containing protein
MERFYSALLENSSDNIAVLRSDGITVYQSHAVERQLGYRPEELGGRTNFELIHPDDRDSTTPKMADILTSRGVVGPIRFRCIHKAGHVIVVEALGKRFISESGETYAIINTRDITQQERLEAQLTQATKMEALGQLAGGVAHDFNNLLTVISGYTETVRDMLKPDDPHAAEIEEIRRAADRAAVLTSQLLAFSRKQVLKSENQDLNAVVREVGSMIDRVIGATIQLQLELSPQRAMVVADRSQLGQILLNLALNSRDAMPYGGKLTMRTSVVEVNEEAAAQRPPLVPGKYVRLEVIDTGSGMSEHVQRHVFEPFFTTKEPGKGTGLGLSTVYGIVKQSRGFIFVDSEIGRGTAFTVYLPLTTADREERLNRPQPTGPASGRETVLLVEDERMVRDLAKQVLIRHGYQVLTAENGQHALEVSREFHGNIDLLVTDIVMAGMSGPDLARRLESTNRVTSVLYMSGYAGDAVLGTGESGVAFLQKPFTPAALTQKVREVLDQSARMR